MQPYRADYQMPDGTLEPTVVVGLDMTEGPMMLLAVAQKDGRHIVAPPERFTATEPSYLGRPEPGTPDHEHEFDPKGEPILEGNRLVAFLLHCKYPGCQETQRRPAGAKIMPGVLG